MRFSCHQSYFGLFRQLKLFNELRVIHQSNKRQISVFIHYRHQPYQPYLRLCPKQCNINRRILFHDNSTDDDQQKKKPIDDTNDERNEIFKLLEKVPRKVVKTIDSPGLIPAFAKMAEKSFAEKNYTAAINTYEQLINQTFDLEWLPYWQMCLGDCHYLNNPPLRDIVRSWYHYECALTKYPQQITLDIMLRVMQSSMDVLEELNKPTRAVELCAEVLDTMSETKNKEKQSDNISYQIFDHVRMTYVHKKRNETGKVLFHATQALVLYKKKRADGLIWKASNNNDDDIKTMLKWIADICFWEKEYGTVLTHLYELNDILVNEPEETSYDYRRHPSFRVSVNFMIGNALQEHNQADWRQALIHYHTSLCHLRLCISSATHTEGRLHVYMAKIWLDQPDVYHLALPHLAIAGKIRDLEMETIIYPPINILTSLSERAHQYAQLANSYDSQVAFDRVGILAKQWAIDCASIAIELLKNNKTPSDQLIRLQSFINRINKNYKLPDK